MTMRRMRGTLFFYAETGSPASEGALRPPVDVHRTRSGWLVKVELAGVRPDDVAIEIRENVLRIHGSRRDYTCDEVVGHQIMEIAYQPFVRLVELPQPVEASQVAVEFRDGMLLLRVHRNEEQS